MLTLPVSLNPEILVTVWSPFHSLHLIFSFESYEFFFFLYSQEKTMGSQWIIHSTPSVMNKQLRHRGLLPSSAMPPPQLLPPYHWESQGIFLPWCTITTANGTWSEHWKAFSVLFIMAASLDFHFCLLWCFFGNIMETRIKILKVYIDIFLLGCINVILMTRNY